CLFGRFDMEQLSKFNDAVYHFEKALDNDIENIPTYYAYIRLTIQTCEFKKANKLLKVARGIKGIDNSYLKHLEGLILEKQGKLKQSQNILEALLQFETCNSIRDYIKKELERVKEKQNKKTVKHSKKRKSKGKKKKN